MQILLAAVVSPIVGLLTLWLVTVSEPMIRMICGMPPPIDDDPAAALLPLFLGAFVLLCWCYVIPFVYFTRRMGILATSALATLPVWFGFTALLHKPELDGIFASIGVVGLVFALPVFAASCTAAILLSRHCWERIA